METSHSYCSTQINLPKPLADKIIEWGKNHIKDSEIYEDEPGKGREDEIHVTVLYGIKSDSPSTVKSILRNTESFTVELETISLFTAPDYDVVKIDVQSHELVELNKLIKSKVAYVDNYPVFKPHVTIAYIQKGTGWKHDGVDVFEGKLFNADAVLFSNIDRVKTKITLR